MEKRDLTRHGSSEDSAEEGDGLSVSVVVYRSDIRMLCRTFASVMSACGRLHERWGYIPPHLYIVDNGGISDRDIAGLHFFLVDQGIVHTVLRGHGNIGYGRGHNLAIARARSRYHLVLNPDVDVDRDALVNAIEYLEEHRDVGLVAPRIDDDNEGIQYLCRRYPTVLDLFVRGFLPRGIRRFFAGRLGRYEMRDLINSHDVVWDPPLVSGCFMLFRTSLLRQLSGFDPRYFLYFEDYDLSLRAHELARVAYVPSVRVVHHGGGAALKGWAHIRMFIVSAFKFYNRFGWKWL
jgi:GT2 family glycosyltransferase